MRPPKATQAASLPAKRRRGEVADTSPGPPVTRRRSARLASKQANFLAATDANGRRSGVKAEPPKPVVSKGKASATATNTLRRKRKAATVEKKRLCSSGKTSSRGRPEQDPKGRGRPLKHTLPSKATAKTSSAARTTPLLHGDHNAHSSSRRKRRPVRMTARSRSRSSSSPVSSSSNTGDTRPSAELRDSSRRTTPGCHGRRTRGQLTGSSDDTGVPGSKSQRWLESSSGGSGSCNCAEKQRRLRSGWTSSNRSSESSAYKRRLLRSSSSSSSGVAKRAAKMQRRARGRSPRSRRAIGGGEEHPVTRGPQLPGRVQTSHEKVSRWLERMEEP